MPHINTEPGQHDHTASAYIFKIHPDTELYQKTGSLSPLLLLHMHKKFKKLLQPGGHIELNENPWQAIKHELLEETGYALSQLSIMQPNETVRSLSNKDSILHPIPFVHNTHKVSDEHFHTDIGYLFITQEFPAHTVGEGESTDLRWVTQEELNAFSPQEVNSGVRDIGNAAFELIEAQNDAWYGYPTNDFRV